MSYINLHSRSHHVSSVFLDRIIIRAWSRIEVSWAVLVCFNTASLRRCVRGDTICPRPARCTHAAVHLQSLALRLWRPTRPRSTGRQRLALGGGVETGLVDIHYVVTWTANQSGLVTLTFDILTLKVVSESRATWAYLTLPYGADVLPPNAEASNGPNAHPRINRRLQNPQVQYSLGSLPKRGTIHSQVRAYSLWPAR